MELFLNAVWAIVAVTALTRLGRRSVAAMLATVCALALLGFTDQKPLACFSTDVWRGLPARAP